MIDSLRQVSTMGIGFFGGGATSTLRRQNTAGAALSVAILAALGASSITVKGVSAGHEVIQGAKFTLAGVVGEYTVAADVKALIAPQMVLTFTPALAGAAAVDAALTWILTHTEHAYLRMIGKRTEEDERLVDSGTRVVHLGYDASNPAPRQGDFLDGLQILEAETVGENLRHRVVTGAAA